MTAGQKKALVDFKLPPTASGQTGSTRNVGKGNLSAAKANSSAAASAIKVLVQPAAPASSVVVGSAGSSQTAATALPDSINLRGQSLYVDPGLASQGRETQIASQPIAKWFGDFTPDVQSAVNSYASAATAQGKLGTLVAYNIPERDCGSYSRGGAASAADYQAWIRAFAQGIGGRQAIVILEPDALPGMDCLPNADQQQRLASIAGAVNVLDEQTKAYVYIDAGNSAWQPAGTMA